MNPMPDAIVEALTALRVEVSPEQRRRLAEFLDLLLDANQRVNLTAVRDRDEAWRRHIVDSLSLAPMVPESGRLIDLGSGGGLPAIPLAILRPSLRFTLLEATGKKCRFLEDATARLGLGNARVWNDRAENAAHDPALRGSFDVCTARAVAPLAVLAELGLPFLRPGGELLAMKGAKAAEEAREAAGALKALGAEKPRIREIHHALLPGACVVAARLGRPAPGRFPRPPGKPAADPLR